MKIIFSHCSSLFFLTFHVQRWKMVKQVFVRITPLKQIFVYARLRKPFIAKGLYCSRFRSPIVHQLVKAADQRKRPQITQLLVKKKKMEQLNGGSIYKQHGKGAHAYKNSNNKRQMNNVVLFFCRV